MSGRIAHVTLAIVLFLTACERGTEPPRNNEERAFAAQCKAEGGEFSRYGLQMQAIACKKPLRPAVDAGKACTDGSQCEAGTCLGATRSCAPVVNEWYCEPEVIKGQVVDVVCGE